MTCLNFHLPRCRRSTMPPHRFPSPPCRLKIYSASFRWKWIIQYTRCVFRRWCVWNPFRTLKQAKGLRVVVYIQTITCSPLSQGKSVKEITKLGKTSLSDFTLCGAELLPDLHQFINCLCRLRRHVWKCERNEVSLRLERGGVPPLWAQPKRN